MPWEDLYSGVVNRFIFSLDPLTPYHQNDMIYFDIPFNIEDIRGPPQRRLVAVAPKHYTKAICLYLKLFVGNKTVAPWNMQHTIDIA